MRIAVAVLAVAALNGCSLIKTAPAPDPVQFNYKTSHGESAGLVRVFNLKGNTVLQFIDIGKAQPKVFDADQPGALSYDVIGQYAIVAGIHNSLRIEANGGSATARRAIPAAAPAEPQATAILPAANPAADTPQAASRMSATETALLEVLAQLDQAKKDLALARRELAQLQQLNIQPAAPLIVPDNDKSRVWVLAGNRTLKENLADMARDAGYAEPNWKSSTPYMVRYRTSYTGTFLEALAQISDAVPRLDFKVSKRYRTIEIVDAAPI